MNTPYNANTAWTSRNLPMDQVRSKRPSNWDVEAAINTAILKGCSAHEFRSNKGEPDQWLLSVPGFIIVYRSDRVIEVQRNTDHKPPEPSYWPDVPYSKLPGGVLLDLMTVYTQMGYDL